MKKAQKILYKHWKFSSFHPSQEKIIKSILEGNDTMVLLPTGGGKSLCYQVPTMVMEGVCVVISPLLALIKDQVTNLKERDIKAIALSSQMTQEELIIAFDNLQFGNYKFLYLSPEKLQSPFVQEKIKQLNVSLFAIDEAHCISEWGHDFRPSYLKLDILRTLKPEAIVVALTATATKLVLKDIRTQLFKKGSIFYKDSFLRKNLEYTVTESENIEGRLLQVLNKIKGTVIIYTNSRNHTKEISRFLNNNKFKSTYYHGGMSVGEKASAYDHWIQDKTPIICATNAFGMGIDKSDVRAVIHINLPLSLENYIQEAGRAGRDQQRARSIILTNKSQIYESSRRLKKYAAGMDFIRLIYDHLNQYFQIAKGELPETLFSFSVQDFCTTYELPLVRTYNALQALSRENIIALDDPFTKKSKLKMLLNNQDIFNFMHHNPHYEKLIQMILRSYGGLFDHLTSINTYMLSKKLNVSRNTVLRQLAELNTEGIVAYQKGNFEGSLQFLVAREDQYTLNRISESVTKQIQLKEEKLARVIAFVNEKHICRNQLLLGYFNEDYNKRCGSCDNCKSLDRRSPDLKEITDQIVELLQEKPMTSLELVEQCDQLTDDVLNSLKILIDKNKITITSQNKFKLIT